MASGGGLTVTGVSDLFFSLGQVAEWCPGSLQFQHVVPTHVVPTDLFDTGVDGDDCGNADHFAVAPFQQGG